jgi:hypothetical protein
LEGRRARPALQLAMQKGGSAADVEGVVERFYYNTVISAVGRQSLYFFKIYSSRSL